MSDQFNHLVFNKPEVFIWFFALIPVAFLMFLHYKRRFPVILKLISGSNDALIAKKIRIRYFFSSLCFLLFIAAMIFAFAGPKMGFRVVRELRRGADVVLAFDISKSMNIKDAQDGGKTLSRLERSADIARDFIESGSEESVFLRCGVAAGKGGGVLAVPIGPDAEASLDFIDALSSSIISSRGTNLESLLDAAETGFIESSPASRFVVLFSDGEELSGNFQNAVSKLKQDDITTIAVGVGSEYGALIPENESPAGAGEDKSSQTTMVRSYLHEYLLKNSVERSGGVFIDGNAANAGALLKESILPFAENSNQTAVREESASIWYLFVAAALCFFALYVLFKLRRRR